MINSIQKDTKQHSFVTRTSGVAFLVAQIIATMLFTITKN
jgi:hypothetical protein